MTDGQQFDLAWRAQWERVNRYYKRLIGLAEERSQADCQDDAWAFFVACWHLHDAVTVAVTPSLGEEDLRATRCAVRTIVFRHPALKVCHDVATAYKHVTVRKPKSARERVIGGHVTIGLPGAELDLKTGRSTEIGEGWAKCDHDLLDENGKRTPAEEIAAQALHDWELLLRDEWCLLPPIPENQT